MAHVSGAVDVADIRPAEASDRDLMAAIVKGDAEALRRLNERYGRMLVALAMRFIGNESDAEEVAADVLWQAWREAKSFDPVRGSVSVWLVTLGRSRAIDRLRAIKARMGLSEGQPDPEVSPDPASKLDQTQRAHTVRAALTGLDDSERAALELAYFSGLSQSEVAERLGIPLGTVKTRIRSAMIKLRRTLLLRQG